MRAALHLIRTNPREFWPVLWVMPAFAALFTLVWIVTPC
jgi:hypothetical protein